MALTLGYWNIRGLCESIRYLLHYVGQAFEDKRYMQHEEWMREKHNLGFDFPNLPYLIDGGVRLTQSIAILRYLARKYHLVGSIESERYRMEVLEQQLVDLQTKLLYLSYWNPNFEKGKEDLIRVAQTVVGQLSKFLGAKKFFMGDELTYVDFLAYEVLDFYELFHPPMYENHLNLKEFLKRFRDIPQLQGYFNSPTYRKWPVFAPFARFGGRGEEPKRS